MSIQYSVKLQLLAAVRPIETTLFYIFLFFSFFFFLILKKEKKNEEEEEENIKGPLNQNKTKKPKSLTRVTLRESETELITGVRYQNLFDMMVDAVVSAMAVAGYENIPVVVVETGSLSSGANASEVEANPAYAKMYLKNLVEHLRSGTGTLLRKEGVAEVYIYELFDKEVKQRNDQNWGILYPNMTKKYKIEFSGCGCNGIINHQTGFVRVGSFLVFAFWLWLLQ